MKKNTSGVDSNDENKDPQKDAGLARLICNESMPSMPEIMRIGMPYPYKKTYCGIELVYDPDCVNDGVCGEEPADVKSCECWNKSDDASGRFSIPLDPQLSPCYAIGGPVRGKTLEPEERLWSIRRTGSSAGDDVVPDSQPGTPVEPYDAGSVPVDAGGARMEIDSKPAPPVDAGVIPAPVDWNERDVFVMRSSGSPIRLRRFSPIKRAASEDPEPLSLPPPSKIARTGPGDCGEA